MQCTDKGSMVRAQFCSEWTELSYGMTHLSDSFVPRWLMKAQPLLCVAIIKDLAESDKDQSCVSLLPSSSINYWLVSRNQTQGEPT